MEEFSVIIASTLKKEIAVFNSLFDSGIRDFIEKEKAKAKAKLFGSIVKSNHMVG